MVPEVDEQRPVHLDVHLEVHWRVQRQHGADRHRRLRPADGHRKLRWRSHSRRLVRLPGRCRLSFFFPPRMLQALEPDQEIRFGRLVPRHGETGFGFVPDEVREDRRIVGQRVNDLHLAGGRDQDVVDLLMLPRALMLASRARRITDAPAAARSISTPEPALPRIIPDSLSTTATHIAPSKLRSFSRTSSRLGRSSTASTAGATSTAVARRLRRRVVGRSGGRRRDEVVELRCPRREVRLGIVRAVRLLLGCPASTQARSRVNAHGALLIESGRGLHGVERWKRQKPPLVAAPLVGI